MSTQSGISASEELLEAFKEFNVNTLVVKVDSDNTSLVPDKEFPQPSSQELPDVFESLSQYFEKNHPQPSYIIIPNLSSSNDYIFISFIPDVAPIRQKMLYASTKNTILQQLGSNNFKNILSLSELDELTHDNFVKTSRNNDDTEALTQEEKDLKTLDSLQSLSLTESGLRGNQAFKKELASMHNNSSSPNPSSSALGNTGALLFDVDSDLKGEFEGIGNLKDTKKLITFNIDIAKETVKLTSTKNAVDLSQLIEALKLVIDSSSPHPQFAIYNYDSNKIAFIYSCPSGSKVKDRMIYASNRQGLISFLKSFTNNTDILVEKVLEVGDLDELDLDELRVNSNTDASSRNSETESSQSTRSNLKFNKPKGPRRR